MEPGHFTPEGIVLILSALGVIIVNIITALKSSRQIAAVSAKADVIAGHVNSTATAQTAKIEGLQKEIAILTGVIADKSKDAAVLAQSIAADKATCKFTGSSDK
jgi:hypothetical protein